MIRDLMRWTWQKDYRTWIAHGLIGLVGTALFGLVGRPDWGTAASSGFYFGDTLKEILSDGWPAQQKKRIDHVMDTISPWIGALPYYVFAAVRG